MYFFLNSYKSSIKTQYLNLQVNYRFSRHPHLYAPDLMAIELTFTNNGLEDSGEIKVKTREGKLWRRRRKRIFLVFTLFVLFFSDLLFLLLFYIFIFFRLKSSSYNKDESI